ncbi:MAG: hypothetical protein IJU49_09520 [Lachnospiraceae bacterium]|nr:hypothetical protein [Lachnospiraceae bacterium]MBQ7602378.1 hypothetical protein [Lachnospiraceae bacterium]
MVNAALLTKIEHKRIQALRFYVEVTTAYKPNFNELKEELGKIDGVHFVVPG